MLTISQKWEKLFGLREKGGVIPCFFQVNMSVHWMQKTG